MNVQRATAKLPTACISEIALIVNTAKHRSDLYEARLAGGLELLCVSSTPFFASARKLIAAGYDPKSTLVMRHAGSGADCLRCPLSSAAVLTVEETKYGPKLRRWKPLSTLEGPPRIALDDRAAQSVTDGLVRKPAKAAESAVGYCENVALKN